MQQALLEWTGQRTVPNVFIRGEHVGGCDSKNHQLILLLSLKFSLNLPAAAVTFVSSPVGVLEKHQQGKLLPMLKDAAAVPNNPAKV